MMDLTTRIVITLLAISLMCLAIASLGNSSAIQDLQLKIHQLEQTQR